MKLIYTLSILGFLASSSLSQAALSATGVNSTNANDATILGAVDAADLGATGTFTGADGFFGSADLLNNGSATPGSSADALYLSNGFSGNNNLPGTYTIALNVATNVLGYDLTSIETFAGWTVNGPQLANQRYELLVSTVDASTTFSSLGTFEYIPFNDNTSTGGGITQMTVEDGGAVFATGVHSVRFIFEDHGFSGPNTAVNGSVYYETDINGIATVPEPSSTALLGLGALALMMRRRK